MHATTHTYTSGATHVTLRDSSGRGIDSMNMSPAAFETYLGARERMSDAEAFYLVRDDLNQEAA